MNNNGIKAFLIQNKILVCIIIGVLLVAAIVLLIIILITSRRRNKKVSPEDKAQQNRQKHVSEARKLCAPDGVNPNPLSYFVLNDNGRDVYIRSMTIDS